MSLPVLPVLAKSSRLRPELSLMGQTLARSDPATLDETKRFVQDCFGRVEVDVWWSSASHQEDLAPLLDLLNIGIRHLVVSIPYVQRLLDSGVPPSRLVLAADSLSQGCSLAASTDCAGALIDLSHSGSLPLHDELQTSAKGVHKKFKQLAVYVSQTQLPALPQTDIVLALDQDLIAPEESDSALKLSNLLVSRLHSDRHDGLFPTLVESESSKALGLVYSSPQSISEAIRSNTGVYQSRRHGLWYKGASSGATQKLVRLEMDCDNDCLKFVVDQKDPGFCHNNTLSCFGSARGVVALESTLRDRMANAPKESYTRRLLSDSGLLKAKIMEEAEELCDASTPQNTAWEAADLIYFALVKAAKEGVTFADIERNLDLKARKIVRRKGDAKPKYNTNTPATTTEIRLARVDARNTQNPTIDDALKRPAQRTKDIMRSALPIIERVRDEGDAALVDLTAKYDGVRVAEPVLRAPFAPELMQLPDDVLQALDLSISNVGKFHSAQVQSASKLLTVETSPGVVCSRFARPIENVGLYVPGGSAVLPSTALMLGVPAQVAGVRNIVFASPPRKDGTPTPEVVYVAHKVGASAIVLAGGAQAIAALAYGTESVPKVDKILGPGNQYVTAAKMYVQNDTEAQVSIDMPAGPSEVLVIADSHADPAFVASDLLSQAEHGPDSQVVLIAVDLSEQQLTAIEQEVHRQALLLPRVEIIRQSIQHSRTLLVNSIQDAFELSNRYAPEHLILQLKDASRHLDKVDNAGSVFVGAYSSESCGDYSSGTNHTLPTYGYARMYSGVNIGTYQKSITSQELTKAGLQAIGPAVMTLAAVEGLDAHRNAVKVRLDSLRSQ